MMLLLLMLLVNMGNYFNSITMKMRDLIDYFMEHLIDMILFLIRQITRISDYLFNNIK